MSQPTTLTVQTRRLLIRPWTLADAPGQQRAINFRAVTKMTAAMPYPYMLRDSQFWIRKTLRYFKQRPLQHMHFAITYKKTVIGAIGSDRDGEQAEFGYWLTPTMHSQGMMTEAVRAFVPFVFRTWPIQRMIAKVFLFNPASSRVLEKCGFEHTAREMPGICKDGKWLDDNIFVRYRS